MTVLIPGLEIAAARKRIEPYLLPTPLVHSRHLSKKTGCEVYLKVETMQPTHTFKVRGAFNAVLSIAEEKRARGILTASGGNHGLGVALACSTLQLPCMIYLPVTTPKNKLDAIEELGARIILHGKSWDEANVEAIRVAEQEQLSYVHAFNDKDVMAGQGTIVLEVLDSLKKVDLIVASIGGGGLISGIISAVQHFSPTTRVAGVETEGADCMSGSIKAGKIIELEAITSIAESLGARKTSERQFAIVSRHASEVAVVKDSEAIKALLELLAKDKLLVEPATSCSVAALTERKIQFSAGQTIVVVLCGGNIAIEKVNQWQNEFVGS